MLESLKASMIPITDGITEFSNGFGNIQSVNDANLRAVKVQVHVKISLICLFMYKTGVKIVGVKYQVAGGGSVQSVAFNPILM